MSAIAPSASSRRRWKPTNPFPAVSSTSGTFSTLVAVNTADGGGAGTPDFALFYTQRPHCVAIPGAGIFFAYNKPDSNHNPAFWRMDRSTHKDVSGNYDGASGWTNVYTEATFNTGGGAPGVLADLDGNLYVIVSQYADGTQAYFKVFKFTAADNYTTPTIFSYSTFLAANKWSCAYDPGRNVIWIQAWQRNDPNQDDLLVIDTKGNTVRHGQLFYPWSSMVSPHADAEYPFCEIAHDGTWFLCWHTDPSWGGPLSYYDDRLTWSTDAGATWQNVSGALAGQLYGDDTGPANRSGVELTDLTTDFIAPTDPNYYPAGTQRFNFNPISGIAFNNGALHIQYHGESAAASWNPNHINYVKWDYATKTVVRRQEPFNANSGATATFDYSVPGNFCQDSTQRGRLLWIGNGAGADYTKLLATITDDGGTTWTRYAASAAIGTNGANYTGCCPFVQPDGSVIGYTVALDAPNNILFWRLTPN